MDWKGEWMQFTRPYRRSKIRPELEGKGRNEKWIPFRPSAANGGVKGGDCEGFFLSLMIKRNPNSGIYHTKGGKGTIRHGGYVVFREQKGHGTLKMHNPIRLKNKRVRRFA